MKPFEFSKHLNEEGKKVYDDLRRKYGLTEIYQLVLASIASSNWQIIIECRQIVNQEGTILETSHGIKANPALKISNDAMTQMRSVLKQLKLENLLNETDDSFLRDFG